MLCAMERPVEPGDDPLRGLTAGSDRRDVARALAGERDAFAALVERHQARVIGHLARLVGEDAQDLAQDTFVRAWTALERYDPAYPFRGWLLVIASRLAMNHRARRREAPGIGHLPEPGGGPDPAELVAEADAAAVLAHRIYAAVARLSPDDRALYELRHRQELALPELAAGLGCSVGALKVRLLRMRRRLGDLLGIDLSSSGADP